MAAVLKYIQPKLHALSNGLFANWTPETNVEIGDYGILKNGGFVRTGSLRDYGAIIEVGTATDGAENEFEYKEKIDLNVDAVAEANATANQGVKVSLSIRGKGAFLYHLHNVNQIRPKNQRKFEEEVARTLVGTSLVLPEGAVLVTEVQHAAKATIIASDGSEGKLELRTDFKPSGSAFLSGAKGRVSVGASAGSIFSWIAMGETVTLLRLVRPKLPTGPGGPGGPGGGLQAMLRWAKDLFKARQLNVSELVVRPLPSSTAGFVVALGSGNEFQVALPDLTVDEMMATAEIKVRDSSRQRYLTL